MPPLTPELEAYILTQIESLFFDVTTFTNEINKQVSLLTANGLSQKQIASVLSNDLKNGGRIFGQLKNNTKAKVVETVNQSSRIGQESEYSGNDKFAWVTVGGHKVCMDCDGRAGGIMTYDQWETEGLPGTGWSVCQGFCYCVLDPTGTVGKKVQVDTTKIKPEKGAGIRTPGVTPWKKYSNKSSKKYVNPELAKATAIEPTITGLVEEIAGLNNMELHGLKYRLKKSESAIRKFMKENINRSWNYRQIFTEDFRDLIRYTYMADDLTYVDDVLRAMGQFEAKGYELVSRRNYWSGTEYKGLNVNFREPTTGRIFEVKFNTFNSQKMKDAVSHDLYEKIREVEK